MFRLFQAHRMDWVSRTAIPDQIAMMLSQVRLSTVLPVPLPLLPPLLHCFCITLDIKRSKAPVHSQPAPVTHTWDSGSDFMLRFCFLGWRTLVSSFILVYHFQPSYVPSGKESACSSGDSGSIPETGRSPGEANSYPFQYSCLENPMDRGAWQAVVHGITKSWTWLSE